MVKNYIDKSVKKTYSKVNRKFYTTPEILKNSPMFQGSFYDVLRKENELYYTQGRYVGNFVLPLAYDLELFEKAKNPPSALCRRFRIFNERKERTPYANPEFQRKYIGKRNCKFELPFANVEVNSNMF